MVAWSDLILPILVSAAFVFIASSVIHMVLQLHKADYRRLSNEDEVCAAIRKGSPAPAQYVFPHCLDQKELASPEMARKFEQGPVGVLYVRPNGMTKLGPFLGQWVAYTVLIGIVVAYLARITVGPDGSFGHVFRVVSLGAWLAYAWQGPSDSIWKGKPWAITLRGFGDGLVYALITGATFAWLWP